MGIYSDYPQPDPHRKRWMMFVDGENLTIRAKALAAKGDVELREGEFYSPDIFVWIPGFIATVPVPGIGLNVQARAIRSYYYTSLKGDNPKVSSVEEALWRLDFQPEVFKKNKPKEKAKGVDITLTKDVLSHAFLDNYDIAVLVPGDGDYVPLVNEVKRLGKQVCVAFFGPEFGLNRDLKLASDNFANIEREFLLRWREYKP